MDIKELHILFKKPEYWRERAIVHALRNMRYALSSKLEILQGYAKCEGIHWDWVAQHQDSAISDEPLLVTLLRDTVPIRMHAIPVLEFLVEQGCQFKEHFWIEEHDSLSLGGPERKEKHFDVASFLVYHEAWDFLVFMKKQGLDTDQPDPLTHLTPGQAAFLADRLDVAMELKTNTEVPSQIQQASIDLMRTSSPGIYAGVRRSHGLVSCSREIHAPHDTAASASISPETRRVEKNWKLDNLEDLYSMDGM